MTPLNHIGAFLLILVGFFVIWFLGAILGKFSEKELKNSLLPSSLAIYAIYEAFYWILKIFF